MQSTAPPLPQESSPSSSSLPESEILSHLSSTSALDDLHSTLLASLQRIGWTERVRDLSLELIRAGRCEKFDDIVDAVVASAEGRSHPALFSSLDGDGPNTNNHHRRHRHNNNNNVVNGNGNNSSNADESSEGSNIDLRVPPDVVEQGVAGIKEALGDIFVIEGEDSANESSAVKGNSEEVVGNNNNGVKKSDKASKSGKNTK